jgi:hypothetical protein
MYQITYENLLYNKSYVKDVSVKFVANMTPYSQAWKTVLHNFFFFVSEATWNGNWIYTVKAATRSMRRVHWLKWRVYYHFMALFMLLRWSVIFSFTEAI